jgi:hypothetical protein
MSLQIGLQKNIILDDISCKIETPFMHSARVCRDAPIDKFNGT